MFEQKTFLKFYKTKKTNKNLKMQFTGNVNKENSFEGVMIDPPHPLPPQHPTHDFELAKLHLQRNVQIS